MYALSTFFYSIAEGESEAEYLMKPTGAGTLNRKIY
jgi:hypothetical protein